MVDVASTTFLFFRNDTLIFIQVFSGFKIIASSNFLTEFSNIKASFQKIVIQKNQKWKTAFEFKQDENNMRKTKKQ